MVELATHLGVQRGDRTHGSSRAALAGAFAALIACTLLAVTHRNSAMPTALTGWLATGHAGPSPFQVPPAEAAAQGVTSGEVSLPFHSSGANYGGLAPLLSLWPSSLSLSHLQHPSTAIMCLTVVSVHVTRLYSCSIPVLSRDARDWVVYLQKHLIAQTNPTIQTEVTPARPSFPLSCHPRAPLFAQAPALRRIRLMARGGMMRSQNI